MIVCDLCGTKGAEAGFYTYWVATDLEALPEVYRRERVKATDLSERAAEFLYSPEWLEAVPDIATEPPWAVCVGCHDLLSSGCLPDALIERNSRTNQVVLYGSDDLEKCADLTWEGMVTGLLYFWYWRLPRVDPPGNPPFRRN